MSLPHPVHKLPLPYLNYDTVDSNLPHLFQINRATWENSWPWLSCHHTWYVQTRILSINTFYMQKRL